MATQSTKASDAVEAALSAVEEALRLDDLVATRHEGDKPATDMAPAVEVAAEPAVAPPPAPSASVTPPPFVAPTRDEPTSIRPPRTRFGSTGRTTVASEPVTGPTVAVTPSAPASRPAERAPEALMVPPAPANEPIAAQQPSLDPAPRHSAANDDRLAGGGLAFGLARRPSMLPYGIAIAAAILWVAGCVAYAYVSTGGNSAALGAFFAGPMLFWSIASIALPPVVFIVLAMMVYRGQEMRLASRSMIEVALRLAEPEANAKDSVVTIGQAIRREMGALGEGLDKAMSRASELEILVHNEVSSLARAYNENELKVRSLIEELGQPA